MASCDCTETCGFCAFIGALRQAVQDAAEADPDDYDLVK
jgi:hypothetical protein